MEPSNIFTKFGVPEIGNGRWMAWSSKKGGQQVLTIKPAGIFVCLGRLEQFIRDQ